MSNRGPTAPSTPFFPADSETIRSLWSEFVHNFAECPAKRRPSVRRYNGRWLALATVLDACSDAVAVAVPSSVLSSASRRHVTALVATGEFLRLVDEGKAFLMPVVLLEALRNTSAEWQAHLLRPESVRRAWDGWLKAFPNYRRVVDEVARSIALYEKPGGGGLPPYWLRRLSAVGGAFGLGDVVTLVEETFAAHPELDRVREGE